MNTTLYPGIPFSPQAQITNNIGAADTIIEVSDVSAFPPAPNLATIGTDEEGETILYTAKTETALSGCQRGVEGESRGWTAGELIGRNFTAKDHADLIAAATEAYGTATAAQEAAGNAMDAAQAAQETADAAGAVAATKQTKLTGQTGQVVGFNADGAAVAVQGWSNPNLLDNWYFADPINQRGQTEYTDQGYGIDRWYCIGTLSVNSGGVSLAHSGSGQIALLQFFENTKTITGETYTISTLFADGMFLSASGQVDREAAQDTLFCGAEANGIGIYLVSQAEKGDIFSFNIVGVGTNSIRPVAAKLEKGPIQTLAHQDADGNWVLNDPPPNKALELLKCQRYMYNPLYGASGHYNRIGFGVSISQDMILIQAPLPTSMRGTPTITNLSNVLTRDASTNLEQSMESISVDGNSMTAGAITCICKLKNNVATGKTFYLETVHDEALLGSMLFDANL